MSCSSAQHSLITRLFTASLRADPRLFVIICEQHKVEVWLKTVSMHFEGNAVIVLDDCAASKDVKGRTGELVKLGFSSRHTGISVWVLAQQFSSITKAFREKAIFEEYAGELSQDELKELISKLNQKPELL